LGNVGYWHNGVDFSRAGRAGCGRILLSSPVAALMRNEGMRKPLKARPVKKPIDYATIRKEIVARFAKALAYLARH
jgi:hypothetical protein